MASEASKVRNQCAKKYASREKRYKEVILSLTDKVDSLESRLADYETMKREYVKLCLYVGLSDEDRKKVLEHGDLCEQTDKLMGQLSDLVSSKELSGALSLMVKSGFSLDLMRALHQYMSQGE